MKEEKYRLRENMSPNRVIVRTSDTGRQDVLYTDKGRPEHGHTVTDNGEIKYARTMGGNVLSDQ
jgi:hypothetical protein